MSTPIWPDTLPMVWTNSGTITKQTLATVGDGSVPTALRRWSSVPGADAQVTWTFLETEFAIFTTFWRDVLLSGHRWFYMMLPSALGTQWCMIRCTDNVFRSALTGYRKWDVSINIEIRERPIGRPIDLGGTAIPPAGVTLPPGVGWGGPDVGPLPPHGDNYSEALSLDDPLIWWRMNEASGTIGADGGRLGLPFTLNPALLAFGGAPLWARGRSLECNAAGFNGGIAAFNTAVNFAGRTGFTITALINWNGAGSTSAIVAHGQTNSDWANWALFVDASGHIVAWLSSANSSAARTQFTSTVTIAVGAIHRVAFRWIAATGEVGVWLDDTRIITDTWLHTLWTSLAPVGVACVPHTAGGDTSSAAFLGLIDEIAIYDKPLTDDRIHAQWEALQ